MRPTARVVADDHDTMQDEAALPGSLFSFFLDLPIGPERSVQLDRGLSPFHGSHVVRNSQSSQARCSRRVMQTTPTRLYWFALTDVAANCKKTINTAVWPGQPVEDGRAMRRDVLAGESGWGVVKRANNPLTKSVPQY